MGYRCRCSGEVNGVTNFGGSPTKDPHHKDYKPDEFHFARRREGGVVLFGSGVGKSTSDLTDGDYADCVRHHASSFGNRKWSYPFGWNCHSFKADMLSCCGTQE